MEPTQQPSINEIPDISPVDIRDDLTVADRLERLEQINGITN